MKTFKKIMYVVDPTSNHQKGLGRVADGAKHLSAQLLLYASMPLPKLSSSDTQALRQAELERLRLWLDWIAKPARDAGVQVTTEAEIAEDWSTAIAPAARRWGAEMIVKVMNQQTALRRRLAKTSDWTLLRTSDCPILFIKEDSPKTPRNLIAAVDLLDKSPNNLQFMQEVIRHARGICEVSGAELHVVNAYPNLLHGVDAMDLARFAEIQRSRAHAGPGTPEDMLLGVAKTLDGPVIVIGSSDKRSLAGSLLGDTAERILDKVAMDVLVIIAPREERAAKAA
ncbi:universal stress protein [Nevskia ramosa]|uniref:universal stress protein n=2 Tax=Nevskia ramosa TaxID=64002 RepID=UPI003D0F34F1